jgi:hypothetical protein
LEKKKYILTIIGFIISFILYTVIYVLGEMQMTAPPGTMGFIPKEYVLEFVVVLPGPLWSDIILLYLLPIISFVILLFIGPYLLVLYLKIHQFSTKIGAKTYYGIVEMGDKVGFWKLFRRALIVSLFSFSISALIVEAGGGALFRGGFTEDFILHKAEAVFLGTFYLTFIIVIIFIPIWLLEDAGIVGYKYNANKRTPPKIEGISSLYSSILEGYAGISTILIMFSYIFRCFAFLINGGGGLGSPAILTPLILIVLPFIITGLFAIPLIIYETQLSKSVNRVHKVLRKFNLSYINIPEFEEVKTGRTIVID